jgi:hypothetical protein
MRIETYKCLNFRGSSPIWIHGLQIRITHCIVIGRLSKQQQAISGKRANVWGVNREVTGGGRIFAIREWNLVPVCRLSFCFHVLFNILKLIIEIIYHEFEVLRLRRKLRTMENVVSILHFICFNMYEVV